MSSNLTPLDYRQTTVNDVAGWRGRSSMSGAPIVGKTEVLDDLALASRREDTSSGG